jgi:Kef-type K+ transport system membrane component KefB
MDIAGALMIGGLLGLPAAYMVRHLRAGEPMEAEALGFILLCGGLALYFGVSYLLAVMMLGLVIINLCKIEEPFRIIEQISWPFMVLFFILSGASLDFDSLYSTGLISLLYILFRSLGFITGAFAGGTFASMDRQKKSWFGVATQPQAGVALGMALIASQQFPEQQGTILSIIIGSTIIYEIFGPILTRLALLKTGEISK